MHFCGRRVTSLHISAGFCDILLLYLIGLNYPADYVKLIDAFSMPHKPVFIMSFESNRLSELTTSLLNKKRYGLQNLVHYGCSQLRKTYI